MAESFVSFHTHIIWLKTVWIAAGYIIMLGFLYIATLIFGMLHKYGRYFTPNLTILYWASLLWYNHLNCLNWGTNVYQMFSFFYQCMHSRLINYRCTLVCQQIIHYLDFLALAFQIMLFQNKTFLDQVWHVFRLNVSGYHHNQIFDDFL